MAIRSFNGFIYSRGRLEDKKEAIHWMTMAAGKGMPSACRYLGFAYMEEKDRPEQEPGQEMVHQRIAKETPCP